MKNLLFGLFATVLLFNLSFGQKIDPSNSQNEFDKIGKAHNEGLDKIIGNKENAELFKKENLVFTLKAVNESGFNTTGFLKLNNDEKVILKLGKVDFSNATLTNSIIDTYKKDGYISSDVQKYLTIILALVTKAGDNGDFDDFKNRMVEIELEIDKLKGNDREFLLSVASISRYSVAYWKTNLPTGTANKGGTVKGAAVADLAGAVGGGVRYGVACLFSGPFGWGALGVACLSTGLGASAVYGVAHLF